MPIQHRKPQPLALEYRFMFDGAAALDIAHEVVVDDPLVEAASAEPTAAPTANPQPEPPALSVVPQAEKPTQDLLALPEVRVAGEALLSDEAYPIWEASIQALTEWLADFANEDDFAAIMTEVYELESLSDGQQRLQALQELLRTSGIPLSIELRESADLNHEMAAFARVSHLGDMRIYVNADWVNAGAGHAWIEQVLVEEIGHLLDEYLRPGLDTRGDEGELFMARVLGWQTSESARDQMRTNQDLATFVIEGMEVEVQLASLSFVNAYEVYVGTLSEKTNESTTITAQPAEKEASRHNFGVLGLGTTRIDDLVISGATFSGNDVVVQLTLSNKLAANGNSVLNTPEVVYGWISRPIKAGGQVKGFYFWADTNFQALGDATSDGNADADRLVADNRGFILVVDQAYFDGLSSIATADSVTYKSVGSSSDRVDSALNSVLPTNAPPTGVNDLANATPSSTPATNQGSAALEQGHSVTTINASGNVLTNDSDTNGDTLSVSTVKSDLTGASTTATSAGATLVGQYGTLTINSAGTWSYAVNNDNSTVNALLAGSLQETFTYTVNDGKGGSATATLTVQINGSNDAPTAVNDYNTAKESIGTPATGGYSATGNVLTNDSDPDSADTLTISGVTSNGTITVGTTSISAGTYSLTISGSPSTKNGEWAYVFTGTGTPSSSSTYGGLYSYEPSGAHNYKIITYTVTGSGQNIAISFSKLPTYFYNVQTAQYEAITDFLAFFSTYKNLASKNAGSDTDNTAETTTNSATGAGPLTITNAAVSTPGSTTLSNLSSASGTIAIGMTVSGPGVLSGTKISEIVYNPDGSISSIKLDKELISANTGTFTFSQVGATGTLISGAHGALQLNANGSYEYTPTSNNPNLSAGQSAIEVFDYTMQDAAGVTSAAKLYITVYGTGSNDPILVADAGTAYESGVGRNISDTTTPYVLTNDNTAFSGTNATGNVITNDTVGAGGSVASYSKSDGSSVTTFGNTLTGLYGSIVIADNGVYTYTPDNTNATVNALRPGVTLTETFIYKVTNTAGGTSFSQLVITIQGTNDQPVAVANTANVTEDSTLTATGNVLTNDTDADSGDTKTVINAGTSTANLAVSSGTTSTNGRIVTGTYGTLSIGADGTYVYALDNSAANVQALTAVQTVTDVFTYEMRDTNGATSTTTLTVTVTGSNEVPINNFGGTAISATQPPAVTTAINTAFSFTGSNLISVTDDGNLAAVVLEVKNGLLSFSANPSSVTLTNSSGGSFSTSGSYIKIEGTQAAINAALALLIYAPSSGFQGSDSLIINSVDSSGGRDIDGIAINIPTVTTTSVSEPALANGTNPSSTAETNTGSVTLALGQAIATQQTGNFLNSSGGVIGTWQVNTNDTFSVTLTAGSANTSSSFTYVAYDEFGNAVNNIVSLTITDDTPLAVADTKSVNEGSTATGNVLTDGTPDKFGADGAKTTNPVGGVIGFRAAGADTTTEVTSGIGTAISGTYGTLTLNADGSYSYVATANSVTSTQTDVFVYTIEDADGDRSTATLTISVDDSTTDTIAVNAHGPVNEGSTYAMFTVVGSGSQQMSLSVTNGTATLSTPAIQYSTDGTTWTTYSWDGTTGNKPTGGTVYVRVAISSESDNIYEGSESFSLTATNITTPSITSNASTTIIDNGTGTKYTGNFSTGTPTPDATAFDDDRSLDVVGGLTFNEASKYATFTVTGQAGYVVQLQLGNTSSTSDVDATISGFTFEYSTDNGLTWTTHTGSNHPTIVASGAGSLTGTIFVRVDISSEQESPAAYEGPETFTLIARYATNTAITDSDFNTIIDDGSGRRDENGDGDNTDAGPEVNGPFDDERPSFSINDVTVNEEAGTITFTVTKTGTTTLTSSVQYAVNPGTATTPADYLAGTSALTGTLSFTDAETTKTIVLNVVDDATFEGSEQFTVDLSSPTNGTISDAQGVGTIKDDGTGAGGTDDDRPSFSINDVTVSEAAGTLTFTVTKTGNTTQTSTVDYALANNTALAGSDYTTTSGTLTFAAGVTTQTITVTIINDNPGVYEGSESFYANLSNAINATISDAQGVGTITDDGTGAGGTDDDRPSFSINDVTVNEAAGTLTFTVTKTGNTTQTSTVDYALANNTALAGSDYTTTSGTLTFAAGETTKTITVTIANDADYEGSESFYANLSNATNATISDAQGVGTIKDDGTGGDDDGDNTDDNGDTAKNDDRPSFSINDVTVNEAAGTLTFTVTKTGSTTLTSTVAYALADDSALAGSDYTTTSGTLTFLAGDTTKTITVTIANDTDYEGSESFFANLSNATNATISDAQGVGTIKDDGTGGDDDGDNTDDATDAAQDDDRPLSVTNVTVNEASSYATFKITGLPNTALGSLAIGLDTDLATNNASITGQPIEVFNGATWVAFAANVTTLNNAGELLVRVSIVSEQDAPFEGPEVFVLSTSYATGSKSATGIGTIRDDGQGSIFLPTNNTNTPNAPGNLGYPNALDNDAPLAVTSVTVNEASPYAVFEVTGGANQILSSLTLGTDADGTTLDATTTGFTLEVFNGTAWVPFAANTTALNANGSLLVRVNIQTEQDSPYEGSEKFTLIAQSPGGAQYSGIGTIKDDGTGSVFLGNNNTATPNNPGSIDPNGPDYPAQLDDDLLIAVSSVTVNEASSFAVFQITGVANQPLASLVIGVDSNNATANATIGYMTVQIFNAGTNSWVAFNPGVTTLDGSGQLLARVNITSEHDTPYEGNEVFTLTATYAVAAKSATGVGTIKDDGTGSLFLATNNTATPNEATDPGFPTALDDDRPLTVSNVTVNENSPYATFEISGGANQILQSLTLGTDSNPATTNADPTGFTLQVFNGSSWVPFAANATQLNNAGKLLVRVAIGSESDAPYEGPEVFTLTTASSGGTPATGTGTIRDDGTGSIYLSSNNTVTPNSPTSQNYTGPQLDDDRVEAEADKDGIAPTVESYLATAARQGDTNAVPGDLNNDGIPDADQNAVTTLAWVDYDKFNLATTNVNTFLNPGDPALQNQNLASIISLKVVESTSGTVIEDQAQLLNVSVIDPTAAYTTLGPATLSTAVVVGKPTGAVWDPFQFSIESVLVGGSLIDVDPNRAGTQVRTLIDISRARVAEGDMIGYKKYVTQAALDGYTAEDIQLRTLDNVVISTAGWYDFTQRTPGGDGARFVTSNGIITAIELTITDNAFGDNDQRTNKIYDPGVPIFRSDDTPSPLKPPPALPPEPPPIWRNPLLLPPSTPYSRGPSIPYLFDSTLRPTQSSLPQYELSRPEPDAELLEDGFYKTTSELARYYDLYTDQDDWRASVIPAEMPDLRVFRGMPDQFVEHAAQGSFTVPWDAFVHTKREAEVRLTATLADDTDLPAWIQLNGQTGVFKVDPPPGISGEWIIKLIARDNEGREAATLFRMHVAASSQPEGSEPRVTPELNPAVPSAPVTPPADAPRRREEPTIQTMALAEAED